MATDVAEAGRRGQGRSRGRSHSTVYFAPDSRAGARMSQGLSDALAQFTADVQTSALRSAVYAGAKVLSAELDMRTRQMADSGQLADAVYHYHDDKQSGPGRQVYAVGVNKSKAPHWFVTEYGHWRINKVVPVSAAGAAKYGKAVITSEDGATYLPLRARLPAPQWVPGTPYLRPTWDTKADEAVAAMQRRLFERLAELRQGAAQEALP